MIIAGVEEAGRGPVIGPLVMALAAADKKTINELQILGVTDSKMLSKKKREELYKKIKELCDVKVLILSPSQVDASLLDPNMNLNWLEAKTSSALINKVNADKVILDCPSNNFKTYVDYVKKNLKYQPELVAEHKADEKYTIVGAASIIAKVIRDKEVDKLKQIAGFDFGSGYPSDPKTIEFLKNNWNKYDFFRKTWKTYQKYSQKSLNDFN
ncbi:MAG: ribonuclease HII [Candidatus Woesearchaeota archaeon]